jgi:hypothetical protein
MGPYPAIPSVAGHVPACDPDYTLPGAAGVQEPSPHRRRGLGTPRLVLPADTREDRWHGGSASSATPCARRRGQARQSRVRTVLMGMSISVAISGYQQPWCTSNRNAVCSQNGSVSSAKASRRSAPAPARRERDRARRCPEAGEGAPGTSRHASGPSVPYTVRSHRARRSGTP